MKAILSSVLAVMLCLWLESVFTAASAQNAPPLKVPQEYEPLAAAAQLALSSPTLTAAAEPGATLTQKRRVVSEKSLVEALDLMHRWLDTPLPPTAASDPNGESLVPILAGVRALGRALYVRSYVQLADGRVSEAIDALRDSLRLSYAIGNITMRGWVSGVYVETLMLQSLSAHFDQFSAQDCDHLLRLAQEWANSPSPLPKVLDQMRLSSRAYIQKSLTDEGFESLIQEMYDSGDEGDPIAASMAEQLERMSPQERQQIKTRLAAGIDANFAQAQTALQTPFWERPQSAAKRDKGAPPNDRLVNFLVSMAVPNLSRITDRSTQREAAARLLGCHAAIRRYQWEHATLPPSLAKLNLGAMGTDPFTGKPFLYTIEETHYKLASAIPAESIR